MDFDVRFIPAYSKVILNLISLSVETANARLPSPGSNVSAFKKIRILMLDEIKERRKKDYESLIQKKDRLTDTELLKV